MSDKKVFFENLDFLRLVACTAVFLTHTIQFWIPDAFFDTFGGKLVQLTMNGHEGVNFFFVLSGFLITYLLLSEQQKYGRISLPKFYIRRFLRIWPLYFAVVLFGFFVYPGLKSLIGMDTFQPHSLPWHLAFLSNFDLIRLYHDITIQTDILMLVINWSVSVEEQFYLFWPLLFLIIPIGRIWWAWVGLWLVSLGFLYTVYPDGIMMKYHSLSAVGKLVTGGLAAWLAFYSGSFIRFFENLPRALIIGVYAAGLSFIAFGKDILSSESYFVLHGHINALFYAFVILEQNYAHRSFIKYSRFKLLSKLGVYTYGFYLLHPIAIQLVIIATKLMGISEATHATIGFGIIHTTLAGVITIAIGWLSYHYFETPFLRLKQRYTVVMSR